MASARSGFGALLHAWRDRLAPADAAVPQLGDITLDCDVLVVPGADLRMVTYTAAGGSEDAGKLDLLRVTNGHTAGTLP
ncbi:hypothetical protein [Nocardia sp. NPDC004260]